MFQKKVKKMPKEKCKKYICIGALMAVGIPLMAIMTKIIYEVCVQGKSVEIAKQYEPVCYCLMGLLFVIGIVTFYMLEEEKGDKK